jgi:hypothetical protein
MFEYNALRIALGLMQMGIVWILLKRDIGYLTRFGILMFASGALHLAPAYPEAETWKLYVQIPAYAVILFLTADATLEFFAFLRRRTFIEERSALLSFAVIVGLIPVWVFWGWFGDNWYQTAMLARQYILIWLTGGYIAAWLWLRAARPIHMEMRIADHGEFWGFWLLVTAAHASTTKWGVLWRFAQWKGSESIWRIAGDVLLIAQICICCGFVVNLWNWKLSAAVPAALPDPQSPANHLLRRPLSL